MANDHLFSPSEPIDNLHNDVLQLILNFIPISEANMFTNPILRMGRSHLMVTKIAETRRGTPGFFDIPHLYEKATGIQFSNFEALLTVVFTRLVNIKQASLDPREFGLPLTYFEQLPIPQAEVSAFFDMISVTPEAFAKRLRDDDPHPNDFRVVRDKPFIRIKDWCFPLDAPSGVEKFETGVFWSVFGHLSPEDQLNFPAFWGSVFEDYILWLFEQSCLTKFNRLHKNPKYADTLTEEVECPA